MTEKVFVSMILFSPIKEFHQPFSPVTFEFPVKAWFTKTIGAECNSGPNS